MRNFVVSFCLVLSAFVASCGQQSAQTTLSGIGASPEGKNAAVIFGAPNGLSGVATDVREFANLLNKPEYDLKVQQVQTLNNAKATDILRMTAEAAKDASTLIWFFSGHGNRGILAATDRTFRFTEVAAAIKAARNDVPLERLVVFIDSCYAGSFVNGNAPIITEPSMWTSESGMQKKCATHASAKAEVEAASEDNLFETFAALEGTLYKQAFVLASSTKDESSIDLGSAKGGAFTWSLRGVVSTASTADRAMTIGSFAKQTSTKTKRTANHTPVYKAYPSDAVLNDGFFWN